MSYYQRTVEERKTKKNSSNFFERVKDIPFWHWSLTDKEHEELRQRLDNFCCFNHVIGLPEKPIGVKHPIYQWQKEIYDAIYSEEYYDSTRNRLYTKKTEYSYFMIKKARSVGGTSLLTRMLFWDISRNRELASTDAIIITGNRLEMSIDIMRRLRNLVPPYVEIKPTRETIFEFNGCRVTCIPSHALSSLRGYERISWIIADEADYWSAAEGQALRAVVEPFKVKSDPICALLSSVRTMFGLFYQIENEKNSMYHKIFIPYTKALGTIFTEEEISEVRKNSPSFEREFNLSYTTGIENAVFREEDIDNAIKLGSALGDPHTLDESIIQRNNPEARHVTVLALDPAFGPSSFAYSVLGIRRSFLQCLYCDEISRPNFSDAISKSLYLYKFYNCRCILVDAANPAVISALKKELGERTDYMDQITTLKAQWGIKDEVDLKHYFSVIPISFNAGHARSMLSAAQVYLSQGGIAIHPSHDKLIYALRTATIKPETGALNKQETQYDDCLDSFLIALRFFKSERK